MKKTFLRITLAVAMLAIASQAHAAILFDTTQHLDFDAAPLGGHSATGQLVTVPAGLGWTIDSMSVVLGEGSEALFGINVYPLVGDIFGSLVGATQQATLTPILAYVPVALTLSAPFHLAPGDYAFLANYTLTGADFGSYWAESPSGTGGNGGPDFSFDLRIDGSDGSLSSLPEPATWLSAAALLSLTGLSRRRKVA